MKQIEIKAWTRNEVGKNKVKKIRMSDFVPSIMYGAQNRLLKLKVSDVERIYNLRHQNFIVKLNIDEKEDKTAFVKDIQLDPVTNEVIHLDFLELVEGKSVTIKVPIITKGTPEGVKKGGILEHILWEVEIETLPKNIPDGIELDISHLDIGDSIHIRDLKVPEGVKIVDSPENVVLTIVAPAKEVEEKPVEEAVAGVAEGVSAPAGTATKEEAKAAEPATSKEKASETEKKK